jgi:hypothetical protein
MSILFRPFGFMVNLTDYVYLNRIDIIEKVHNKTKGPNMIDIIG